ncbi:MAG: hypothetical protein RSG78_02335 [Oscillospiraceae bacterium]
MEKRLDASHTALTLIKAYEKIQSVFDSLLINKNYPLFLQESDTRANRAKTDSPMQQRAVYERLGGVEKSQSEAFERFFTFETGSCFDADAAARASQTRAAFGDFAKTPPLPIKTARYCGRRRACRHKAFASAPI